MNKRTTFFTRVGDNMNEIYDIKVDMNKMETLEKGAVLSFSNVFLTKAQKKWYNCFKVMLIIGFVLGFTAVMAYGAYVYSTYDVINRIPN